MNKTTNFCVYLFVSLIIIGFVGRILQAIVL